MPVTRHFYPPGNSHKMLAPRDSPGYAGIQRRLAPYHQSGSRALTRDAANFGILRLVRGSRKHAARVERVHGVPFARKASQPASHIFRPSTIAPSVGPPPCSAVQQRAAVLQMDEPLAFAFHFSLF